MHREYTEFEWHTEGAGNGESGEKLTRVFIQLVKKLEGVRSICDLGCGNGHISGRLAALGYQVTGIDASASGITIARHTYPGVDFIETLILRPCTTVATLNSSVCAPYHGCYAATALKISISVSTVARRGFGKT